MHKVNGVHMHLCICFEGVCGRPRPLVGLVPATLSVVAWRATVTVTSRVTCGRVMGQRLFVEKHDIGRNCGICC